MRVIPVGAMGGDGAVIVVGLPVREPPEPEVGLSREKRRQFSFQCPPRGM
jgi:hypothetical protein